MNDIKMKHKKGNAKSPDEFSMTINGKDVSVISYALEQKKGGRGPTRITLTLLANPETSSFEIEPA